MAEYLTFDGEDLVGPITCEDLSPLRSVAKRGSNRPLPSVDGTRPYPRRTHELDVTLTWRLVGRTDHTGTPNVDQETGVEVNIEHYRTLFTTGADADGQHPVVLHYAGTEFTGDVQVADFSVVRTGPTTATLLTRFVVAAGELEAGS